MKQKKKILWMLLPVLIFVGCGTQDSILKRGQPETGSLEEQQDTETVYNVESETQNEKPEQKEKPLQEWIYVDVCGAVRNPGVPIGSEAGWVISGVGTGGRLYREGFIRDSESGRSFNRWSKIWIYTKEEAGQMEKKLQEEDSLLDDRVDINRAGKEELMTLTGVGETRAQAILAYRETHGSFSSVEELMQVEGIKEKTYEKLKDQIRIN